VGWNREGKKEEAEERRMDVEREGRINRNTKD
jgi:hypothetical protein